MLTIRLNENEIGHLVPRNFEWHVGEKFPIVYGAVPFIAECQADGDELLKIVLSIEGIPNSGQLIVRWFDSDAKFICGVLQMEYRGRE